MARQPRKIADLPKFYKEYFIYTAEDTSIVGGTGTVFEDTTTRFDRDANFEAHKFIHVATDNRIYARFNDNAMGRYYSNAAVDLRHISGTAFNSITPNGFMPFILPAPLTVHAGTTLTTAFADFSGSTNSVRFSMHGAKIMQGIAPWLGKVQGDELVPYKARVPFFYTQSVTLGASSAASLNISVNYDADFMIHTVTGTRTAGATITIQDGSQNRSSMDRPVHLDNFMGNSQFPNKFSAPRFIRFGSVINLSLQDLSGSSNTVSITFTGEKLYN